MPWQNLQLEHKVQPQRSQQKRTRTPEKPARTAFLPDYLLFPKFPRGFSLAVGSYIVTAIGDFSLRQHHVETIEVELGDVARDCLEIYLGDKKVRKAVRT